MFGGLIAMARRQKMFEPVCNKHKISNTGARCFRYEYLAHGFPRAKV
jgi:hypothetical protein